MTADLPILFERMKIRTTPVGEQRDIGKDNYQRVRRAPIGGTNRRVVGRQSCHAGT